MRGLFSVISRTWILLFGAVVLSTSGCSLDMFSKSKKDPQVEGLRNYQARKTGCSNFSVPNDGLDSKSFRGLMACFDSNGSIRELHQLVGETPDTTLDPLVELLNHYFINDPSQVFESQALLDHRTDLAQVFKNLSQPLQDSTRIQSLLLLLDGFKSSGSALRAGEKSSLVKWISDFSPEDLDRLLGILIKIVESPEWSEIREAFQKTPLSEAEKNEIQNAFTVWLHEDRATLNSFLKHLISGEMAPVFSALLSDSEDGARVMSRFVEAGSTRLQDLQDFYSQLQFPVSCFGGAQNYSEPWNEAIGELKLHHGDDFYDTLLRVASTQFFLVKEVCSFPSEIFHDYSTLAHELDASSGPLLSVLIERAISTGTESVIVPFLGSDLGTLKPVGALLSNRTVFADVFRLFQKISPEEFRWLGSQLSRSLSGSPNSSGDPPQGFLSWLGRLDVKTRTLMSRLVSEVLSFPPTQVSGFLREAQGLTRETQFHPWFRGIQALIMDSIQGRSAGMSITELSELPSFGGAVKLLYEMGQDGRLGSIFQDIFRIFSNQSKIGSHALSWTKEKWSDEQAHGFPLEALDLPRVKKNSKNCSELNFERTFQDQKDLYFQCQGSDVGRGAVDGLSGKFSESIFALLRGSSFGSPGVRWISQLFSQNSLPSFLSETAELLTGSETYLTDRLVSKWGSSRVQQDFERFKNFGVRLLNSPRLGILGTWFKEASDSNFHPDLVFPKPEPCFPPEDQTRDLLRKVECVEDEDDLNSRISELRDDYLTSTVGWESLGEGRSRKELNAKEVQDRLRVLQRLVSKAEVSQAVVDLLGTLKKNWGSEKFISWFIDRVNDPVPTLYWYPGEAAPRVRLMNTLDRLEVVLTAADFKYGKIIYKENFVIKFMTALGESYGDLPRNEWPLALQKKYPLGKRPPTQRETYLDIKALLDRFIRLGAYPKYKTCSLALSDEEALHPGHSWIPVPGFMIPQAVKINLFNLKQVFEVVDENLPDAIGPHRNGMGLLRDIFYGVSHAREGEEISTEDENPLSIIRSIGRLGLLRQISTGLEGRSSADLNQLLQDVTESVFQFSGSEYAPAFVQRLFSSSSDSMEDSAVSRVLEALMQPGLEAERARAFPVAFLFLAQTQEVFKRRELRDLILKSLGEVSFDWNKAILTSVLSSTLTSSVENFLVGLQLTSNREAEKQVPLLVSEVIQSPEEWAWVLKWVSDVGGDESLVREILKLSRSSNFRHWVSSMGALFPIQFFTASNQDADFGSIQSFRTWMATQLRDEGKDWIEIYLSEPERLTALLKDLHNYVSSPEFKTNSEIYSRHLPH